MSYNESQFPETYRELLYYLDVTPGRVRACVLRPKGATFEVTHEFDLLRKADKHFHPHQLAVGPDGAIYVCGHDNEQGRLYRLNWGGTQDQPALALRGMDHWAKILKQSDDELIKTLESESFTDRLKAQQELVRRGAKHRPALLALLKDFERPVAARIAALGAAQAFWDADVQAACIEVLGASQPDLRRLAADALGLNGKRGDRDLQSALEQILNDEEPRVRRSVYLAIGKIAAPGAGDVLVSALQFDDSKDVYLRDGLVRGLEHVGKPAFDQLLALADSGPGKDLDRLLEVYPAFRTRPAAAGIPTLLRNYHVKTAQKVALIRSYYNYQLDPPLSLRPLQDYLDEISKADEKGQQALRPVRIAAAEVLASQGVLDSQAVRALLVRMLAPALTRAPF